MQNHTAALLYKPLRRWQHPEEDLARFRQNCAAQAQAAALGKLKPEQLKLAQAQQQQLTQLQTQGEMMDPAPNPGWHEMEFRAASHDEAFIEGSASLSDPAGEPF